MDKEKIEAGVRLILEGIGKTRTEKGFSTPLTALPECMRRFLED